MRSQPYLLEPLVRTSGSVLSRHTTATTVYVPFRSFAMRDKYKIAVLISGFVTIVATVYLWCRSFVVHDKYKSTVLTGLVLFIAAYRYIRIFKSWEEAYDGPVLWVQETEGVWQAIRAKRTRDTEGVWHKHS